MTENGSSRSLWPVYAGVGAISAATLTLEIALTRVFSFVLWYHFAFMSISIALLGFGASGVVASTSRRLRAQPLERIGAVSCALFALASLLSLACISRLPLDPAGLGRQWLPTLTLALDFLVLTVPFFFSGLTVVTVISRLPEQANRVYCVDLVGGGIGCFLLLGLIGPLGGEGVLLGAGVIALVGALCIGWRLSGGARASLAAATLGLALLAGFAADLLPVAPRQSAEPERSKALSLWLDRSRFPRARHAFSAWNAYSRIDVVEDAGAVSWLRNPQFPFLQPPRDQIIIDGDAATSIVADSGRAGQLDYLKVIPSALAYQALRPRSALVIGAGGGVDVATALVHGAAEVDAVEINPLIVGLMRGPYAAASGSLFSRPGVTLVLGEGRNYVRSTGKTYDLVQLSLIDTWAALSSGAYSLSENFLYTVEAFQDYYRHLTPAGALAITRWHRDPPRETLRLCTVAAEALRREGVAAPERHFIVYGSPGIATVVMKRAPLTADEVSRFVAEGERRGLHVAYDPFTRRPGSFQDFFDAPDRREFFRSLPFDVSPVTDDSPFFFLQGRWRDLDPLALFRSSSSLAEVPGKLLLLLVLAISLCFSVVLLLLPLLLKDRRGLQGRDSERLLLYFFGVGVAFMVVEVLLMQKFSLFLGHPVYAISLVLFSLLIFSGLGSFASRALVRDTPRRLGLALGMLALVVLVSFAAYPRLFDALLGQPLSVRAAAALAALFPLGFLMGIPFPAGIREAERRVPGIVPWAWAVNGFASVASSSLCVLLAMEFGFSAAAVLAGGVYLLCGGIMLLPARAQASGGAETG